MRSVTMPWNTAVAGVAASNFRQYLLASGTTSVKMSPLKTAVLFCMLRLIAALHILILLIIMGHHRALLKKILERSFSKIFATTGMKLLFPRKPDGKCGKALTATWDQKNISLQALTKV